MPAIVPDLQPWLFAATISSDKSEFDLRTAENAENPVNRLAVPHLSTKLELEIESIAQGGDGVGRHEGYVIFARGGLPGERVRVALEMRKKDFARGRVVEVLQPAPERILPRIPDADHMPWQHITYEAQLRFKQAIVQEQLRKLAGTEGEKVAPVLPAATPWNYRNTARLHVQHNQQQGLQIGYYAAGSGAVRDIADDPLLLPVLNESLAALREVLHHHEQEALAVCGVTLRGSATYGQVAAVLHGTGGDVRRLATRWHRQVPCMVGCIPAASALTLREDLGRVTFLLSPESFFQVHTAQAETLLAVVRKGVQLRPGERLLDAYSGAGTFALPLAEGLREVVAIEENTAAVNDGTRSAHHNGIAHVCFLAGRVERVLPTLRGESFDAAVLDPPRRGCHPEALAALAALAPPRLAYISCHPGMLARDVRVLLDGGYRLAWVQPVDLFPQTPHIECVALLERTP